MSDIRTYNDSFLYKNSLRNDNAGENKNSKTIQDYIRNSKRIDKTNQAFIGINEEIKRRQTTRVIFSILKRSDVHLCINNFEMPAAFKVIDARDITKENRPNAIFIDCTGLIEYKDGYFICRKIDVLITYLYDALVYLLYRYANIKMMNNSDVVISSTSCYVSLFKYILDYLGIIGYSENQDKIAYLTGLFYLHTLMGKELDNYSKNVAAKISGINLRSISAYDLYLEPHMFDNINTFIVSLKDTFNLKGLTLEVFLGKWMWLLGKGTQYGLELYTCFGQILASAYCGSYVVHQKQIERTCGSDMIKYNNAIRKIGDSTFTSIYGESLEYHDAEAVALAAAMESRDNTPKCKKADFASIDEAVKLVDTYKDFYKNTHQEKKLPKAVLRIFDTGITVLESYVKDPETAYEEGAFCACVKNFPKAVKTNEYINAVTRLLTDKILICSEASSDESLSAEDRQRASRCLAELREVKNNI